ncbi:uncharacterized protein LOC123261155 [Cotesia glomerata]|uniref:Uncharacterized protein n=1 Tax=Cotesia glomerata TaxID=32391 RepID=A0AAV7IFN6_COTGL|nr:uncharacterized protein LOC123261155 [Cotesia glomerata]KAH0549882.1 hypothetical protein KQX54_015495 [Cotesia glomerata]
MRVTRYFAVKVIIVILNLLTVCHPYPSSVGIENDKNEEIKKSFKQKSKNIRFNNVNITLHRNIKINLKRFDRSVDSKSPELGAMDPLTHDDLNLSEILVTSSPAETTQQNNSCCGQKINLYFKTTVSIIKQWLDSLVDDCNKVNEILTFETTKKSDIENIRYCCTELKGNYFKLFKSVISALKKLQIDNHSAINNTCPILAGLEKIKNNIITFTQRPNKIMMMNNPFDNLLKRFPGMSETTNKVPQNNSNSMTNHENTGLNKVIENLWNVPQKIKVSIEELINNIRKNLIPGSCQKLQGSTDGNTSDHVDNRYHSSIHQKLPFLNPFENVLKLRTILNFPFNNPILQVFNNLRDLPQQIKEIIDEQISNIRDIFTKNDCKEVAEMTNNDSGSTNSSDSSTHEKLSTQEPSNGLLKNWFNSSMSRKSTVNNPFSQALNNLHNIPQKIRKSIDDVISNIRHILTSGKYKESKVIPNHSNLVTNSSVQNNISVENPFRNKLEFPSLLKSPFNNPFSQVFDNLRNLLQQIRETIDEQISHIRNLFTKNNCKELTAMANNDSGGNNSSDSSTHEKLSTQEPSNGFMKNWFGSPITEKSIVNNPFSQAFDNLSNILQRIRKSIDELISKIRNILILEKSKGLENKINHTPTNPVTDSSDAVVHETTPSSKPGDVLTVMTDSPVGKILSLGPLCGLFNKLINSSTTSKDPITSSTNPFLQAFDHLRNSSKKMQKSIGEQISHLRNIFTKNNHQESKTIANSDTAHPNADNNSNNFFNMLFKDMRKTSTPVKVLSHNSQLFGKNIDEISTNIRNFFVPQEPKTEIDIFDPSHIYKMLSSSPFVLNELFTNIFKSLSDTKSSGHYNYFSAARDILHNLGKDARKSISALFGGVQHMLIPHIRKGHKKQPTATKILIQQPYYELFKKQLYHKPLSLPTRKILPFSSSFHKDKLFSRSRSDSSKYNFLKKFL